MVETLISMGFGYVGYSVTLGILFLFYGFGMRIMGRKSK